MSVTTIFTLLRIAIGFASGLVSFLGTQKLLTAGQSQQIAKDLAELQVRLGISDKIAEEVKALSDDELNSELRGDK